MWESFTRGGAIVLVGAILAVAGYAIYDRGRALVDILGLFHVALMAGGLLIVCLVADHVAPRRDGGSWFGVLFNWLLCGGDDGDGGDGGDGGE